MPNRHVVMRLIDKTPDGSPAALHTPSSNLPESGAAENLVHDINDDYNAKTGKAWGYFQGEFGVFRAGDYGISESFAADKRALNQYRRYTGRAEGMSISFEAHLLGERVEFDQDSSSLTIKNLPTQMVYQLNRSKLLDF